MWRYEIKEASEITILQAKCEFFLEEDSVNGV